MCLKNLKSKGYVFTKALLTLCGMIFLLWKVGIFPLHFVMVKISLIYWSNYYNAYKQQPKTYYLQYFAVSCSALSCCFQSHNKMEKKNGPNKKETS